MWIAAENSANDCNDSFRPKKSKLSSLEMHRMQLQILDSANETNSEMSITANITTDKESITTIVLQINNKYWI